MKKVIIETVTFDKLIPGGQAMGQLPDGRKVFCHGVLPGETVSIQLTKLKSHYAEAIPIKIISASPDRVGPMDACYLSTSPWQIMDQQRELDYKTSLTRECFLQQGIDTSVQYTRGDGNFYHYRNKMEYALWYDHDDGLIHPAFHQRGSHQKIKIDHSSIELPAIWQELLRIIDNLNHSSDRASDYSSIMVRANQAGQVSSGLFRLNHPRPIMPSLTDQLLGHTYSYSPNGFFQINLPVYEMVLKYIKPLIKGDRVIDLYSGVGTIGLSVARDLDLTLVETDPGAFSELTNNVSSIGSPSNIHSIKARSEDALSHIHSDMTVIVDPPRAGLDKKLVDHLLSIKPPQIIYISCNPITCARDISFLRSIYNISSIIPFNFFPRTPHIETLAILARTN